MLLLLALAPLLAASAPRATFTARFEPAQPQQGDTVAVIVTGAPPGAAPTVTVNGRSYTAFDIGDGRRRALVPVSPLDAPGRWRLDVAVGGEHRGLVVPVAKKTFKIQRIWLPKHVKTELDPIERARVGEAKALATAEKRWAGAFLAPAGGRISSPYGVRRYRNGVFLTDYYHRGIDYAPGADAPVVAPAAGRVVLVGAESAGFPVHGNVVGLDHGQGVVSLFLHLSRVLVKEGEAVAAGEKVGLVGATGAATGPHLHWGLYVSGVAVDPLPWLTSGID
jgi:murein DD-endopeptidase MepM/ murein hydrolase activator NlpD